VFERLVGDSSPQVTVYSENDFRSPYASGSAKVDAYVICPCSMATVGTLASGAMQNLIHRAASVALKERRTLVLVPRETPLSSIHLRGLATLNEAGAVILFAAPGFYHAPETIDDLVDFLVARCLDQLGIDNVLAKRWGNS
jgi:flavin prenyltransferase